MYQRHLETRTCTPKCRSNKHIQEINALLTKTSDTQVLLSAIQQCWNCQKMPDKNGRYCLHMAASCGRAQVCEWLIKHKKAELNLKTIENGFTPAHCASFYGNIDALVVLTKYGANLSKNDSDRLTPLEILSLDKWTSTRYQPDVHDDFDVYCWGSNENFNLGIGHEMKKTNAEMIDFFKKSSTSIIQIVCSKFHSLFLSSSGEVWSCGFGLDGRLGHDDEQTLMTPKRVQTLVNEKVIQICASRNNSYFLTADGVVYSCGTDEFSQLGQSPLTKSLVPRQINFCKKFKGKRIKQIECSRFHCALLTESNEVFTFGLNAGQLGHLNETVANNSTFNHSVIYISEPRLITSINEPDLDIESLSCSDGTTICLQGSKNVLHVFNDYKCKRLYYIKETGSPFKKVKVLGGKLDSFSWNQDLKWMSRLNEAMLIVGLTKENLLFIWREQDPVWRNICWSNSKKLLINDFDLNNQGLVFSTIQGVCYKTDFCRLKQKNATPQSQSSPPSANIKSKPPTFFDKTGLNVELKTETLDLVQVPFLSRCFRVVCDIKARNFFALQYHPNTNMLYYPTPQPSIYPQQMREFLSEYFLKKEISNQTEKKSSSFDYMNTYGYQFSPHQDAEFNDIELKFNGFNYHLHRFIILNRCQKFFSKHSILDQNTESIDLDLVLHQQKANSTLYFDLIIEYIYTNEFSHDKLSTSLKMAKVNSESSFLKFLNDFKEIVIDKFGFSEFKLSFDSKAYTKTIKDLNLRSYDQTERIDLMAKYLMGLLNPLSNKKQKILRFSRNSYPELYDCQINCNNDQSIECHKCILIARSEYFRNMMLGSWLESQNSSVSLPFDIDLMQIIIDYLYTDDIQLDFIHSINNPNATNIKNKNEREIEILFNLYILSDQLLVERLKSLCEFKLTNLINLKNIVEMFEFSHTYDAKQLKDFCMEFISNNLVTLIESKQLEYVDSDLLTDLSKFYRNHFHIVGSRFITPYDEGLNPSSIELIPLDLLYDQKFIDGVLDDEQKLNKKQQQYFSVKTSPSFNNENDLKNVNSPSDESFSNDQNLKSMNEEYHQEKEHVPKPELKWEKVRKKAKRKISEKQETPKSALTQSKETTIASTKFGSNTPTIATKSVPIPIPIPIETTEIKPTELSKQNSSVESSSLNSSLSKKEDLHKFQQQSEWPDLNETVVSRKNEKKSMSKFKKLNTKSPQMLTSSVKPSPTTAPTFSWGNLTQQNGSTTALQQPATSSLIDVMNEELSKLKIKPELKIAAPIKKSNENKLSNSSSTKEIAAKSWNVPKIADQSTDSTTGSGNLASKNQTKQPSSIAEIIEIEKKSKAQYEKLKNRPLHLIQMEEKAILDLKKYYCVDSYTNMNIKIELVEESLNDYLTPIWSKK